MLSKPPCACLPRNFFQADFTDWQSDAPPDLLFANAALQWAGNHADLLPRLVGQLAEGGVLAVRMPDNLEQPSHLLMAETARLPQWQPQMQAMKTAGRWPRRKNITIF